MRVLLHVLYHKDLEYPSKPFDEAEMNYNEYKKLKDLWMDSEQRHTTLALRRIRDLSSASKKRKYDGVLLRQLNKQLNKAQYKRY